LESGPDADREPVRDKVSHLWSDPDLRPMLDQESCDALSAPERKEARAARDEIDSLVRRAQEGG
jgi:hypothetical protein